MVTQHLLRPVAQAMQHLLLAVVAAARVSLALACSAVVAQAATVVAGSLVSAHTVAATAQRAIAAWAVRLVVLVRLWPPIPFRWLRHQIVLAQ